MLHTNHFDTHTPTYTHTHTMLQGMPIAYCVVTCYISALFHDTWIWHAKSM